MLWGMEAAECPGPAGETFESGMAMTADQRLILKLEQISEAVDDDRLIAAYHMLDEVLRELDVPVTMKAAAPRPAPLRRRDGSDVVPPLAAAG